MTKNWTLKEIREVYRENLKLYNETFPPFPERRKEDNEGEPEELFHRGENYIEALDEKLKKVLPKLKAAANESGNAVVWVRGQSLDGLNEGIHQRIRMALDFGV